MRKALLFVSLVAICTIGCKSGPIVAVKDPGPAAVQPGVQTATSTDKTTSIIVAPGWRRGSPGSLSMASFGGIGGDMSEGMSGEAPAPDQSAEDLEADIDAEDSAELEKKGILIWVNDSSRPIPGEERTSYRVKRTDDGPKSLADAAADAKQDLLNEGPIEYVDLPIGKAARMEAKTTKIDGGELFQIVYIVVNVEHIYNIKFTTQNDPSSVKQYEKQVMDSLRIKPAKG